MTQFAIISYSYRQGSSCMSTRITHYTLRSRRFEILIQRGLTRRPHSSHSHLLYYNSGRYNGSESHLEQARSSWSMNLSTYPLKRNTGSMSSTCFAFSIGLSPQHHGSAPNSHLSSGCIDTSRRSHLDSMQS